MIKFDILKRFSSEVAFTAEIDCAEDAPRSLKVGLSVKWGVENNADLRNADLRNANLRNANLWNANLWNAHGLNTYVKCIQIETYSITYTSEVMQIGCERHSLTDWKDFDDTRIAQMDGKSALKFWRKYKDWIFQTIELCPALPTKAEDAQ